MYKYLKRFLDDRKPLRVIIDAVAVIIVWRGVWGLFDLYVFPDNQLFSYIASLCIGTLLMLLDGRGIDEIMPK